MDHHPELLQYFIPAQLAAITTQGTTILIFLLVFFLVLAFFISGAEVAYFSLTYKEVNMLKTKQQPSYKRIVDLLEHPKTLLTSLQFANVLVKLGIIVISSIIVDEIVPLAHQLWWVAFLIKVLIITIVLVLFGDIMPKEMAMQNNIRFARDAGPLVSVVTSLFGGVSNYFAAVSDFFEKIFARNPRSGYNLEELDDDHEGNETDTAAARQEKNMLRGILKFGQTTARQVMKARLDVSGINQELPFKEMIELVSELHYSRLPVYKEDLDEVVGMLHTKDLLPYLNMPHDFDWHSLIRPAYFIHEQKLIEDLLQEFQAKRIHFAVVVDEFGGTSGIVTLEDIMEEIIGEIKDEFDEEDADHKKLDDYNYIFEGKIMINDVCRLMEIPVETFDEIRGESESIAGLVLELAGEIPQVNQVISNGDFDFTVIEVEKNRLQKIKVTLKPQLT